MKRRRPLSRRRAGHTLAEMVIVGMIVALVGTFATKAWTPIGDSIVDLRTRAVASSELRLAAEYLRDDFGGAQLVVNEDGEKLLIRREEDAAALGGVPRGTADPGIRYWLEDGHLMRRDLYRKVEFVAARDIQGFSVRKVRGKEIRIAVTAGLDKDQRTVTLAWVL